MDENFEKDNLINNNENLNDIKSNNINNDIDIDVYTQDTSTNNIFITNENIAQPLQIKRKKIFLIAFIFSFIFIIFISTIFTLVIANKNTIISGITIKGIDVSNLTREQAIEKITTVFEDKLSYSITLTYNEQQLKIFPDQLSVSFDIDSSVDLAYSIGRNSNILKNNFDILSSLFFKTNISPSFTYNEASLNTYITEFENTLPNKQTDPNYYIDGSNLIIVNGKDGIVVDRERLKFELLYHIGDLHTNIELEICVIQKNSNAIDIDKIYSEIYKEAKDAYYTQNPFCIYPHSNGIDFAITIDEAKSMLQVVQDTYTIPLKITTPSVTTNDIGTEAFPDLLATYTTTYSTKNVNRSTNIQLACNKINGTVLMPSEVFSYNTIVGKRTTATGFKPATVYVGGEVTTGIGGGICQVSSTLYNSVLLSNLEVVERVNHGFYPGYVPVGRDATVSWGGPDFRFKNNRNYPIKIVCTTTGGKIITEIYGLKEENEYDVEISSYITKYIQYKTVNQEDNSLPIGTTNVIQDGSNGYNTVCYKILKQNGEIISKTLLSSDTYNPHNKIVAIGTKVEE